LAWEAEMGELGFYFYMFVLIALTAGFFLGTDA
jgi:hypothetical protein